MIAVDDARYVCFDCATEYIASADRVRCDCGGPLELPLLPPETPVMGSSDGPSLRNWAAPWALERADLGEQTTPLVQWSEGQNVWLKCDHLLPTGSFKDRGARSVVARALELGVEQLAVDSSGNAGASIAAHAARAGLESTIFVPAATSASKVAQMRAYGANVELVPGPRKASENAALAHCLDTGAFYASHSTNPYFHDGTKGWFYEVLSQLPRVDTIVVPVGSGSLLLGALRAFDELTTTGWIGSPPRVIIAQAEGYASLAAVGSARERGPADRHPLAEGIAIAEPARRQQMLDRIAALDVTVSIVDSGEVKAAHEELGNAGYYVEPTSAAAWAAWRKSNAMAPTVVALTGHGLKVAV